MRVTARVRRAPRALWGPLVAVLVLLGLFAMHGLPMQQPASPAVSMSMSVGASDHATHTPGPAQAVAVMDGCGSDGHCVATVHPRPDVPTPALVRVDTAAPAPSSATSAPPGTDDAPTGRPPDLDDLGISRT